MTRIAVLDDWQRIARTSADWTPLSERAELAFFERPLPPGDATVETLADFDIILAMRERTAFPADIVERLPKLKFFNMTGRRARGLDDMVRRGIVVSITGGGESGEDTAEHTLALMLAAVRRIPECDASIRNGRFQDGIPPGVRLAGRTLGIVGLGLIGTRVAGYAKALGMNVLAWSRSLTPEKAAQAGVHAASRDELFSASDIVSLHLVLSVETRGIVGVRELGRLRHGAVLINTSRGPLVEKGALLSALAAGRIQAALDVFDDEPLPAADPLRKAANTVLTPHVGYGTLEAYRDFYRISIENTLAYLNGSPVRRYEPARHEM